MTRFVEETCRVELDECAGCGATRRIEAFVGSDGESFDPRSRFGGYEHLRLWSAHPWHRKSICHDCRTKRVFEVEGIAATVPNMVRIRAFSVERCPTCDGQGCDRSGCERFSNHPFCQQGWIYDGNGLRLPPAPPSEDETAEWESALVIDGGHAVALHRRCGYWVPTTMELGHGGDEWLVDLADRERVVVLCEPTPTTTYPTVLEPLVPEEGQRWARSQEPERWGAEVCRRMVEDGDAGEAAVVRLRVSTEILQ